jgi:pyrroline-5-carboxylate reductase
MTKLRDQHIGFLGGGAMAQALATGLLAGGVAPERMLAADPVPARREALAATLGVRTTADNAVVLESSDIVVLAVKPGIVAPVLEELAASTRSDCTRPLWISIAAGIPLSALEAPLGEAARVVRAMPNTPALVGAGATALASNAATTAEDRALARQLFESVGSVWEAPAEPLLDAVTGLSGSGPAFVLVFLEALGEAGVKVGLPREAASKLALQTLLGTARLALESGEEPAALREQVTSPGGTTLAGLERLEAAGLRAAVHAAVEAATRRSRELGKVR